MGSSLPGVWIPLHVAAGCFSQKCLSWGSVGSRGVLKGAGAQAGEGVVQFLFPPQSFAEHCKTGQESPFRGQRTLNIIYRCHRHYTDLQFIPLLKAFPGKKVKHPHRNPFPLAENLVN